MDGIKSVVSTILKGRIEMKVVFLDYDGVVNTPDENGNLNYPEQGSVNNYRAVELISRFCKNYDCSVVITSTWKMYENYRECLFQAGLDRDVIILGKIRGASTDRIKGITEYLKENEIKRYLIFDDISDMGAHTKYLVYCNFDEGFNEKCYNKAVKIELGLKNDEEY